MTDLTMCCAIGSLPLAVKATALLISIPEDGISESAGGSMTTAGALGPRGRFETRLVDFGSTLYFRLLRDA